MQRLQLGLTGGHTIAADLDAAEAKAAMHLITRSMTTNEPIPGCLELHPDESTITRIRLQDIVLAELVSDQPPEKP